MLKPMSRECWAGQAGRDDADAGDDDTTAKKRKAFDVENACLGARSSMTALMQKGHKELTAVLTAADAEASAFDSRDQELQDANPLIRESLERRKLTLKLVLGSCQPGLPSMAELRKNLEDCATQAEEEEKALQKQIEDWVAEKISLPMTQKELQDMGVMRQICVLIQKLGHEAECKEDLDQQTSAIKIRLGHMATLIKRSKAVIEKSKKTAKDHEARKEKEKRKTEEEAQKAAKAIEKAAQAQQRKLDKEVSKAAGATSLFDLDIAKLGGGKIVMHSPEDFQQLLAKQEISLLRPWCVKAGDALKELRQQPQVSKNLAAYESAFPGSAAATRGKQRMQTPLDVPEVRTKFLEAHGCAEASGAAALCGEEGAKLHVWGYGEKYEHKGSEVMQLASLRYQTGGCRVVVCGPAHDIACYLQALEKGSGCKGQVCLKDMGQLLESMVAPEAAELLKRRPKSLYRAVIPFDVVMFIPAGWIVCEKSLNMKCVFGVRASFIPKGGQSEDLANLCAMLRMMQSTPQHSQSEEDRLQKMVDHLKQETANKARWADFLVNTCCVCYVPRHLLATCRRQISLPFAFRIR